MNDKGITTEYGYQREMEQLCWSERLNDTYGACVALAKEAEFQFHPYDGHKGWWIKQAQLIVRPPVDATQFVKFLRLTREYLHFRTTQVTGSYEAGCSLTIYLDRPILLTAFLTKLWEICKVEAIGYEASAREQYPDIVKRLIAIRQIENDQNRVIFVNISNDQESY
jgi:hypothetical protein